MYLKIDIVDFLVLILTGVAVILTCADSTAHHLPWMQRSLSELKSAPQHLTLRLGGHSSGISYRGTEI